VAVLIITQHPLELKLRTSVTFSLHCNTGDNVLHKAPCWASSTLTAWSNFYQYSMDLIIWFPQLLQAANSLSKRHWTVAIRIPGLFVIRNIPSRKANTKLTISRREKHRHARRARVIFLRVWSLGDRSIHGAVYSNDLVDLTSFWLRCKARKKLGIYDVHTMLHR